MASQRHIEKARPREEESSWLWQALGPGEATPPPRDLWPDLARRMPQGSRKRPPMKTAVPGWVGTAVAVLLSLSLGHLAGRGYLAVTDTGPPDTALNDAVPPVATLAEADPESPVSASEVESSVEEPLHLNALQSTPTLQFVINSLIEPEAAKESQDETG